MARRPLLVVALNKAINKNGRENQENALAKAPLLGQHLKQTRQSHLSSMAFRLLALALALRSATCLKPPRLKLKLPTTSRRVATLEPPPPAVDTEPRINLREASPLTVDAAWLLTTRQLDSTDATPTTRQLDESNETPTHWRRAARVQRMMMRFAPLALVGALSPSRRRWTPAYPLYGPSFMGPGGRTPPCSRPGRQP